MLAIHLLTASKTASECLSATICSNKKVDSKANPPYQLLTDQSSGPEGERQGPANGGGDHEGSLAAAEREGRIHGRRERETQQAGMPAAKSKKRKPPLPEAVFLPPWGGVGGGVISAKSGLNFYP
jgi:hypothetical protein